MSIILARVIFGGQVAGFPLGGAVGAGVIVSEEAMGCAVIRTHSGHLTHKVIIDEGVLDRVAEALGIPLADRGQIIPRTESIHIYRGTWPTPAAPPSPTSRRTRQRK
jgi:hypothetical protein